MILKPYHLYWIPHVVFFADRLACDKVINIEKNKQYTALICEMQYTIYHTFMHKREMKQISVRKFKTLPLALYWPFFIISCIHLLGLAYR